MKNTMSHFFFSCMLSLALCLLLKANLSSAQAPNPSPASPNLIEKACQSASDKTFCTNLLQSDHTSPKADMKGLSFIFLKNVEKTAVNTSLFIKIALDKPETDMEPGIQQALSDCNDHYLTAIELIEDSINALVSNAPDDVSKFMKAAVADLDDCDAGVKGQGGIAAEVLDRNLALHRLIDIAFSVYESSLSPN